ncbi:hypothetical protein [uncultured Rikenella sp.]|uniref:hypothetical protein n=1 Tax=uncultured Rikenella sp. TaxID=368003 RepID=UPI00272D49BC|nr:hypothetical protein [uncultured Rikenella sp.]
MPNGTAPGYRYARSGQPTNVGSRGYSWSTAIGWTHGMFLYFDTMILGPSGLDSRGHGLQLRCLSE